MYIRLPSYLTKSLKELAQKIQAVITEKEHKVKDKDAKKQPPPKKKEK